MAVADTKYRSSVRATMGRIRRGEMIERGEYGLGLKLREMIDGHLCKSLS